MTDAVCNMTKSDFEHLKYIQALDMVEEEIDQDSDWDKSLWDVKRALWHRKEDRDTEVFVEFKDPNKPKQ